MHNPEFQRFMTAVEPSPPFEYAVVSWSRWPRAFLLQSFEYRTCLDWIIKSQTPSRFTIVRRATGTDIWRSDWQDD